jgi:hypothetical protein
MTGILVLPPGFCVATGGNALCDGRTAILSGWFTGYSNTLIVFFCTFFLKLPSGNASGWFIFCSANTHSSINQQALRNIDGSVAAVQSISRNMRVVTHRLSLWYTVRAAVRYIIIPYNGGRLSSPPWYSIMVYRTV